MMGALRRVLGLPGRILDVAVPVVAAQVLRRADLTALVLTYVDLDQVVARIDVNAIARRIDLDALLDAADLPEIIRESTGALASDTVRRTRLRGIAADEAVRQARNRLLRRDVRPT
jgi:CBS-domain-containing membrane protein